MIVTALAALAVALWAWFVSSTFLPVVREAQPVEYVFVGAPLWIFWATAAVAAVVLRPIARRRGDAAWPLLLLACAPVAAVALVPGIGPRVSPLLYLLVDLRPWWTTAIAVWVMHRAGFRLSMPHLSVRSASIALCVLLAAWATATTPHLRFDAALHGDEPKYLRYCENWYQGKGLEVGNVQTMAEFGRPLVPPFWRNGLLFARGVGHDVRYAIGDLKMLFTDGFGARFNRAEYAQAWIVRGRNGGYYQVHNPGLSALLFPAYAIDRHVIARSAGHQGVFPDRLPVTNLAVLLLWAGWGVALFVLLRVALDDTAVAWVVAALTMMTMPMAAFGFQIYPESAAGIIVCLVLAWVLKDATADQRAIAAAMVGTATGFLPWLHVRFLVISLVLVAWAAYRARRRTVVLATYSILLAALCAYAYHITGSLRPDSMYAVQGAESSWIPAEARQSVVSLPIDRIWGFLPHAPVYLLSLTGWVLLARRSRSLAIGLALVIASLAIPVAGHGFSAPGATPLRQLAAVIPLASIPLWIALNRVRSIPAARAAATILAVLTLDTALSYNRHHFKEVGRHIDAGVSGWAPNLLFPWTHGDLWVSHAGTYALFLVWVSIAGALLVAPMVLSGVTTTRRDVAHPFILMSLVFLAFATIATALGGEWTRMDYFVPARQAHDTLVTAAMSQDRCRLCVSSTRGAVGRADIVAAGDQQFTVDVPANPARANEDARLTVRAWTADGIGWGTIAADLGDGTSARLEIAGRTELRHRYAAPGTYRLTIRFDPATGPPRQQSFELQIQ